MDYKSRKILGSTLLLGVIALFFFGYASYFKGGIFFGLGSLLLQNPLSLSIFVSVFCGLFLLLTFQPEDLPLIGLIVIAESKYLLDGVRSWPGTDAITLLTTVTLGKCVRYVINQDNRRYFAYGIVTFIAIFSFPLGNENNIYHGLRWTGDWCDPNLYGILLGCGFVLVAGLFVAERKRQKRMGNSIFPGFIFNWSDRWELSQRLGSFIRDRKALAEYAILVVIAGILVVGLLFSYCRGSWLGAVFGLLYLMKSYGKCKWRFILPCITAIVAITLLLWNVIPDTAPWYIKRLDLSQPSVQHRVAAWRAACQVIRDHPLGVGWNKVVSVYETHYSAPKDGAEAILTNAYLMLGAELGIPALLCFVFAIRNGFRNRTDDAELITCRAGAIALLAMFWFDGGLFELPTACIFWTLLELGNPPTAKLTLAGWQNQSRRS